MSPTGRDKLDFASNAEESVAAKFVAKVLRSEAAIIAAVPVCAYALVFSYELGYFSVFGIPAEYASFELARIFIALMYMLSLAVAALYLEHLFRELMKGRPQPVQRRLRRYLLSNVVALALLAVTTPPLWIMLASGAMMLLFTGSGFILPLWTQRNVKGYLRKLASEDRAFDRERARSGPGFVGALATRLGRNVTIGAIVIAYSVLLAWVLGRSTAQGQDRFRVMRSSPERIVLWTFGDYVLAARFDRVAKEVERSYAVLDIGEHPDLEYTLEYIGPLRVVTKGESGPGRSEAPRTQTRSAIPSPSATLPANPPRATLAPCVSTPIATSAN